MYIKVDLKKKMVGSTKNPFTRVYSDTWILKVNRFPQLQKTPYLKVAYFFVTLYYNVIKKKLC